jgi:hypothetical protein
VLGKLRIVHPYGVVDGRASFGVGRTDYTQYSAAIKTFTERIDETETKNDISAEMERAECIIFLGFAFHSQNLRMLRPKSPLKPRPIFATAYGMSAADVEVVTNQLTEFFAGTMSKSERDKMIRIDNKLKCAELFDYYAKSLTGGD